MDKGQHLVFGQLLRVHPGLRIVNYDTVYPGPEEPLRVANAEKEDEVNALCFSQIISDQVWGKESMRWTVRTGREQQSLEAFHR